MKIITLTAVLYIALHLLGRYYPACLWGTDQLHYYPFPVYIFFILTAAVALALSMSDRLILQIDRAFGKSLRYFSAKSHFSLWSKALFVPCFIALAYTFRDRTHFLGDSAKWFTIIESAVSRSRQWDGILGHHSRLDIPGLEYINIQQALDLFIHFQVYRLGHAFWNWNAAEAYEWISCLAGGCYVIVLWHASSFCGSDAARRLTVFSLLITLGSSQLFFGYGESYTLVVLVSTLYALYGLRFLQGMVPLIFPTALLLLAIALHLIALSLVPSWLFLLWRNPGRVGTYLRCPRINLPLCIVVGLISLYGYIEFYRPLHLPLWEAGEEGRYALLSLPHGANLVNEVLLLSPFGLVWGGIFLIRRQGSIPPCSFLGWTALGSGMLISVHYISMGGRDWDLMAFPGLFYSLWGIHCLNLLSDRERLFRQARWTILPLMVLHTALWIGVNNDSRRATDRLGNLLKYTPNQALHYQHFTLGHYYIAIQRDDARQAVYHFREALRHTPPTDIEPIARYKTYLGNALIALGIDYEDSGQNQRAIEAYQEAIQLSNSAKAYYNLAILYDEGGQRERAIEAYRQTVQIRPNYPEAHYNLGIIYQQQGQILQAVEAYQKAIDLRPNFPEAYRNLAIAHSDRRQYQQAIEVLREAIRRTPDDFSLHHNLGSSYLSLGKRDSARAAFRRGVDLGSDNAITYLALGSLLREEELLSEARQVYKMIIEINPRRASIDMYLHAARELSDLGDAQAADILYRKAREFELR